MKTFDIGHPQPILRYVRIGPNRMRKSGIKGVVILAITILAVIAVVAIFRMFPSTEATIYDPRFELLGVRASYGTNHGSFPDAGFRWAIRAVGSRVGMQLPRAPDDKFTSSESSHAVVVRYRYPVRNLSAQLICDNQIVSKKVMASTRFAAPRRSASGPPMKPLVGESVACFYITEPISRSSNYTLRLTTGINTAVADINIGYLKPPE